MTALPNPGHLPSAPLVSLVDDDHDNRAMYRQYLEWEGFRVVEATDGLQAIEQARTLTPAVIVMDLTLPRLSGWEALRRLKADPATKHIPVLALTAHALVGDDEKARAAGCDLYVTKPCLPEDLAGEIRSLIKGRSTAPDAIRSLRSKPVGSGHRALTAPANVDHDIRLWIRTSPPREDQRDGAQRVLGDVLYVGQAKTPVPEADWVRLVQSIAAGDQRALHALYERTNRIVFTLAVRITGNRETAEEVTLDVFHDVWRRASRYDAAGGSVVGWIMNQARSRAIDRLRFEQRKKRVGHHADGPLPATAVSDPHDALDVEEQGRLLRSALTVLTPEERQAIETAFFSELTYAEAAVRLNQPLGTVKTRIRSGLGKLRQALGRGVSEP